MIRWLRGEKRTTRTDTVDSASSASSAYSQPPHPCYHLTPPIARRRLWHCTSSTSDPRPRPPIFPCSPLINYCPPNRLCPPVVCLSAPSLRTSQGLWRVAAQVSSAFSTRSGRCASLGCISSRHRWCEHGAVSSSRVGALLRSISSGHHDGISAFRRSSPPFLFTSVVRFGPPSLRPSQGLRHAGGLAFLP